MKFTSFIYFIVFCGILNLLSLESKAQNNLYKQNNIDSAAINNRVKQEFIKRDSILYAMKQKRIADSINREQAKRQLQNFRDSLINARNAKRIADSMARVNAKQKLIDDKRKADSIVVANRNRIADSIANARLKAEKLIQDQRRIADSIAYERKRISDSSFFARKKYTDSLTKARLTQRKAREDLEKYRDSKRYKDSINTAKLVKQNAIRENRIRVTDSIKTARQSFNDSVKIVKQAINDSIKTVQKNINDNLKAIRESIADSISTARKMKKDSLDLIRSKKEKKTAEIAKEKTKEKQDKALSIKVHDAKTKEWTNEKLLKKSWSLHRRIYQNTVTRYNYFYNARIKYNESLNELKNKNKDDYSKNIHIDPYDFEKDGNSVAANMDSVIKKSSFSTQIHDPRSKWFDNLYFLMGKAYYVKNDYDGAIATFQFIANEYKNNPTKKSKPVKKQTNKVVGVSIATIENNKGLLNKLKHKPIRNKALIWLAKSYMMAEQYSEAITLINTLEKDINFPKKSKPELLLTKTTILLKQDNTEEAINSLTAASKLKFNLTEKARAEYLLAQLLSKKKDFKSSNEHFKKSMNKKTSDEMRFFAKMSIAENAAKSGDDMRFAINQLEKIIKDSKYEKYKSQALNTLALIQAKENPSKAISILKESIGNKDNQDNFLKAIAFAELGSLYYNSSEYKLSKMAYDSASFLGSNPPLENIYEVNTRKDVLSYVVNNIDIIQLQDSLLNLSKLSDKEKLAIAKKAIEKEKKKKAEEVKNESQVIALQPVNNAQSNWYFYNNTLIQKGSNEFKDKWGARKLEDNWRRSNSSSSSGLNMAQNTNETSDNEIEENNINDINAFLTSIPTTPAQKDKATNMIMDAYYNLGLIYFSQLEDYTNSSKTFETLLTKYATTDYKKQVYYGQILNHSKLNNPIEVDRYKKLLRVEFPNSELNTIANNENYNEEKELKNKQLANEYDSTYQHYKDAKYQEAINEARKAKQIKHPLLAKYQLVEAMSFAGLKKIDTCKSILQNVISLYPNTNEQKRAQEILNYIISTDTSNHDTSLIKVNDNQYAQNAADSMEASPAFKELRLNEGKGNFIYNPNTDHFVMIFIKSVDGKTMSLKSGISDYNLLKHDAQDYKTTLNMLTAQQAFVTIQKFSNALYAKKYLNNMIEEKLLFGQFKTNEYTTAVLSQQNFIELLKTRDILGYLKFYKKSY